jgi:hypothetical protein
MNLAVAQKPVSDIARSNALSQINRMQKGPEEALVKELLIGILSLE